MNIGIHDELTAIREILVAQKNALMESLKLTEFTLKGREGMCGEYTRGSIVIGECYFYYDENHFALYVNGHSSIHEKPENENYLPQRIMLRFRDFL
jgi:hypothetical protein